jgi:hypothetical protein
MIVFLLLIFIASTFESLEAIERSNPLSIFTSGLVDPLIEKTPSIEKIIYVVPWNEGKQMALKYAHKFDIVVLCWFDVIFEKEKMMIEGEINYDHQFIG